MAQKPHRAKRRGPVKNTGPQATPDRYQKYLPEWMKDGAVVARPPRPRRARPQRPVGGYTPGKFAIGGDTLR